MCMSTKRIEAIPESSLAWPNFVQRHPAIWSKIIEVWWRVFALVYGSEKKLGKLGVRYMRNGQKRWPIQGIVISDQIRLQEDIKRLKQAWKWVIIWNHHSSKFPDYLPVFWCVWDDILQKTLFFTGPYNLEMNRKLFPDYQFEPAVERGKNEMHKLNLVLKGKLQEMKDKWGYIFLLPAWPGVDSGDKPFQALFGQILRGLAWEGGIDWSSGSETPVMTFHVEHSEPLSYGKIVLKRLGYADYRSSVQGVLTQAADWPERWWAEQRVFYNRLFKKSV